MINDTADRPTRIQRQRTKGWRAPEGAVYVGRGTRWGNPYKLGTTLVRYPATNGDRWELEGRLSKTPGEMHHFRHPDGTVTWHQVEPASIDQVLELYRRWLTLRPELIEQARMALPGRALMCWCPPGPCHADILLAIANT